MIPKIDQFYLHHKRGVIKFAGYSPSGFLLFDRYDKWGDDGWRPQNRLQMLEVRTKLKPIPPPQ